MGCVYLANITKRYGHKMRKFSDLKIGEIFNTKSAQWRKISQEHGEVVFSAVHIVGTQDKFNDESNILPLNKISYFLEIDLDIIPKGYKPVRYGKSRIGEDLLIFNSRGEPQVIHNSGNIYFGPSIILKKIQIKK